MQLTRQRDARSRLLLAGFALGILVALWWLAGCTGPNPEEPTPPIDYSTYCAPPPYPFNPFEFGFASVGTDSTLDLATWNLEFFPLDLPGDYSCFHPIDPTRQQILADIINTSGLDVIAVQEVSDTTGFRQFLDLCPGYDGVISGEEWGCNFQRPAVIYRRDQVRVRSTERLYRSFNDPFPREPYRVDFTITSNGSSYDLSLIVVHLKAGGTSEDVARRREATVLLKSYLDKQAELDSTANFMIAGDWNDVINEPISASSFPDFLNDTENYVFLDTRMAGISEYASIGTRSLIDHLLVNRAACPEFTDGRVTTLRYDQWVSGYSNVSDHRPVMVQAPVFR